jgi:hypothetical protein
VGGGASVAGVEGPESSICDRKEEERVYIEIRGAAPTYTIEVGWWSIGKRCVVASEGRLV